MHPLRRAVEINKRLFVAVLYLLPG
uniref:Uncharacterized protein n=1 Tax=mine drainage metagenome TaxID=410659 RepID=E6QCW2_9ZZZZ